MELTSQGLERILKTRVGGGVSPLLSRRTRWPRAGLLPLSRCGPLPSSRGGLPRGRICGGKEGEKG